MQRLLRFNCLGYVEKDEFCQKLLREKMNYGIFNQAPIFSNIKAFISEGYAKKYKGMVDLITAGFPCQPFSVAGRRKGEQDERNLWPETLACIREVQPRYAFLENVPGLLTSGYFGTVIGQMAEIGYGCKWTCLSALRIGANHKRSRLWILAANTNCVRSYSNKKSEGIVYQKEHIENKEQSGYRGRGKTIRYCKGVPNGGGKGLVQRKSESKNNGKKLQAIERSHWWNIESNVGRVAYGIPHRVDRIKGLGNAQVPIQAAAAFQILAGEL